MADSVLRTALEGFVDRLGTERDMVRATLHLSVKAVQAEFPDWTVAQSSGYIAAQKARADTLTVTVFRLERLLTEAGDK